MITSLRIYRTFKWVPEKKRVELIRFGEKASLVLEATETLQFLSEVNNWCDVEIVEAAAPPYPTASYPAVDESTASATLDPSSDEATRIRFNNAAGSVIKKRFDAAAETAKKNFANSDKNPKLTSDRSHPDLIKAQAADAVGQNNIYLVLSDEELAKGFVRPYRDSYRHHGCGSTTTMGKKIAETYAADPLFYGSTFCAQCNNHFPVRFFSWTADDQIVGS